MIPQLSVPLLFLIASLIKLEYTFTLSNFEFMYLNVKLCKLFISDVSGGYSISMLDAMRCSITVSNIIASAKDGGYVPFNYQDALRLATISGAEGNSCFWVYKFDWQS